jgi:imidazolonepropionase
VEKKLNNYLINPVQGGSTIFTNFVQSKIDGNMPVLIKNIRELVQVEYQPKRWIAGRDMSKIETIPDAYLLIDGEIISSFGKMADLGSDLESNGNRWLKVIDASGKMVFPCWCDSHTHLVFPASREIEYIDKIRGISYEEIARRGGGILNSARKLHETPERQLYQSALERLEEIMSFGTGAVEIKSGYGLTTEDEIKILRVIRRLKQASRVTIISTFLGAHAIPQEYKSNPAAYVDLIINEMIPLIAAEELADYIDVFCDRGFFSEEDTDRILNAGMKYGLRPKIHANELGLTGGVQVGVKYNALSVDHLEYLGEEEISVLKNSETMPTVLPGASFFLGLPYAPVRMMINAGLPVALASDFNPGSSPSGNMQFVLSLGCIKYKMLPEEAINATTINGAYAMGLENELGSIAVGKKANIFITKEIPTIQYMPYAFGSNKVERVILNGKI